MTRIFLMIFFSTSIAMAGLPPEPNSERIGLSENTVMSSIGPIFEGFGPLALGPENPEDEEDRASDFTDTNTPFSLRPSDSKDEDPRQQEGRKGRSESSN